MSITIHRPADKTPLNVVGDLITPLVNAGTHEVFEITGPVGSGPPPHAHPWNESYIVLAGELVIMSGELEQRIGPGQVVQIQAGALHSYRIAAPDTRFFVTTNTQQAGVFFADVDANVPPGPPTPASMPTLIEIAIRNGLTSPLFHNHD